MEHAQEGAGSLTPLWKQSYCLCRITATLFLDKEVSLMRGRVYVS